jgi:hypothetical protein
VHAAGSVQACGIEHRWATSNLLGEDVAAGIGCAARRASGALAPVSLTASAKLIPTWNTCDSASSTAVRRVSKFSGAKNRQPSTTKKRPTRVTSVQQFRNEFSVCSMRVGSGRVGTGDQADDHLGIAWTGGPALQGRHQRVGVR